MKETMVRNASRCARRSGPKHGPALQALVFLCIGLLPAAGRGASERCDPWAARAVSVQGTVEARGTGATRWEAVSPNDIFCPGDTVRIQTHGRSAFVLPNGSVLRLDQGTTIAFVGETEKRSTLIELISGAAYFFSRRSRGLTVITPFVNASVEGTEFLVRVEKGQTLVSLFEGSVVATNAAGSLALGRGQSAVARSGTAPALQTILRPRDAVQWTLYYPPLLDYRQFIPAAAAETGGPSALRRAAESFRSGDLAAAFAGLEQLPAAVRDPYILAFHAALLLAVGQADEAQPLIAELESLDSGHSLALALRSIIAVTRNERDRALLLAGQAVKSDPRSSFALIALSYARQAAFDLQGALESLERAVAIGPDQALTWARLAELRLCLGRLDPALAAARRAAGLDPDVARTQTVLGFACLLRFDNESARPAFLRAVELDQGDPLPRLGLGLASIRHGDLGAGRGEIEIAVGLDPDNALLRSYLGKAYFEEKRPTPAADQYTTSRELDPLDPTPWFYDALLRQSLGRPVEALRNEQRSIALNDNRAIYRSRLQLDADLAARSAGLGRIYQDLGFEQLALAEGRKSLDADPTDYSAHRFLADFFAALPRHEAARVSELLQSQLLQPLNLNPLQPELGATNLSILEGTGPSDASFNEYHPLFLRDRLTLQAGGVTGQNDTRGDEVVLAGLQGRVSYSLGRFHYHSGGFRENSDLEQDILNLFTQAMLSPRTSLLAEYRDARSEKGDLELTFTNSYSPDLRQEERSRALRLGAHHQFSRDLEGIATYSYQSADLETVVFPGQLEFADDVVAHAGEACLFFRRGPLRVTAGAEHLRIDDEGESVAWEEPQATTSETSHTKAYAYSQFDLSRRLILTLGAATDFLRGGGENRDQFNPKLGLTWNPFAATTLRAAVFRTLQRPMVSHQSIEPTLEPTQVAGFNQYYLDAEGDEAWRYGFAVDQRFSENLSGGAEISSRDLDVRIYDDTGPEQTIIQRDWQEQFARAYFSWTPYSSLAFGADYLYERFERDATGGFTGVEQFTSLRTHRVPLGARCFLPGGLQFEATATYIDQQGVFTVPDETGSGFSTLDGDDRFWILDAAVGYRFPKRLGFLRLEIKNLLDQEFAFQDTDPGNPRIVPDRLIVLRLTISF